MVVVNKSQLFRAFETVKSVKISLESMNERLLIIEAKVDLILKVLEPLQQLVKGPYDHQEAMHLLSLFVFEARFGLPFYN
jgi:hypothetical protein